LASICLNDFAELGLAAPDRALEPFGVGHQADLHEHAFQRHQVLLAGGAVLVAQAVDLAVGAGDFGGLGVGVHRHVGQALQLVHQHGVGLELVGKLDHVT
jgi:hypothetical protein